MSANDRVRTIVGWKRLAFSLVPAFLIVLVLFAAEIVLRITGPVVDDGLVTEVQFDGTTWYQTNRAYLAKYFPAGSPMVPEFKTILFRKEKLPQTFRVMCLGSSTMFGTPYDMNANIPGILRRQLRHRYPKTEWEVMNCGASAINSNVVRDLAPDLLAFRPDLVLIYMGHNEYYGPDGIGAFVPRAGLPVADTGEVPRPGASSRAVIQALVRFSAPRGCQQPHAAGVRRTACGFSVRRESDGCLLTSATISKRS